MQKRRLLTVSEVARLASLTPDRIRQLERAGKLPATTRAGAGIRLFDRQRVHRFLMDREAQKL